jgi:hypothetical protein
LSGCAFCNRCTLRATPCCSRWCCSTVASRYTPYVNKHVHCKGSLCRARWRQTLPARGLLEVRSRRHRALVMNLEFSILWPRRQLPRAVASPHPGSRHRALRCARRGQAVPARGLPQASCYGRHAPLPGAWGRQAVPAGGLLQGSRSRSRQHALRTLCLRATQPQPDGAEAQ